jgi:hypothetical protein
VTGVYPTVEAGLALATDPVVAPVWTDVTPWLRGWSLRRGGGGPFEQAQAGTAEIVLDNRDRRFDPSHAGGPYYGLLLPSRRLRLRATWASTVYDLWHGYVEDYRLDYAGPADATATLTAADGLAVLAAAEINEAYPAQRSDERVGAVLDACGWTTGGVWVLQSATQSVLDSTTVLGPGGDRVLDEGMSVLQAADLENTIGLAHLQQVEASEGGRLFVDAQGSVVFHNRRRQQTRLQGPLAVFGDAGVAAGELPYAGVELDHAVAGVWNEVRLTAQGAEAMVAGPDLPSKERHFRRTLRIEGLLNAEPLELLDRATSWLNEHKAPRVRIVALGLAGARAPADLWPQLLGRELGDVVTVRRRPPGGGGAALEQESRIDGIEHARSAGGGGQTWRTVWRLSPAPPVTWLLDDPVNGVLGTTSVLGY